MAAIENVKEKINVEKQAKKSEPCQEESPMFQTGQDACSAVEEAADLIFKTFDYWHQYTYPFRFALAIGQRASFRDVKLNAPVLDIGINDGSTARIIHYGKSRIDWGADMPEESTGESHGLYVAPNFNIYNNLIGMDACDIPFPDNSFNTIVSTEVFFYGMDRRKLLSEIVRVLAPGGTLAFSESSPEILKFPGIAAELKKDIPTFNVPERPKEFYQEILSDLGMGEIFFRPYFDKGIAALTLYLLYAWPPDSDRDKYHQLVQSDPRYRRLHEEGLAAIASMMRAEFKHANGPEGGFNIFVSCRKPGKLSNRPSPRPCCLFCRSSNLQLTLQLCKCKNCGHVYQTRFGRPYLLRDYSTAYCPKPTGIAYWAKAGEKRIDSALNAFYDNGVQKLGTNPRIIFIGIDRSTEYTITHLRQHGIEVEAVCSANPRYVGQRISNIKIIGLDDLGAVQIPLLLSGPSRLGGNLVRNIRNTGYRGRIFSIRSRRVKEMSNWLALWLSMVELFLDFYYKRKDLYYVFTKIKQLVPSLVKEKT